MLPTARSRVKAACFLALLAAATLAEPAAARSRIFRALGFIMGPIFGNPDLLPLPITDPMLELELSFDDAVADTNPANPNSGVYPISALSVTIDEMTVFYVDDLQGHGEIRIASNPLGPQSWTLSGCMGDCEAGDFDEARLRFVFADQPLGSDALVDPPMSSNDVASFEFGLFSSDSITEEEARVESLIVFVMDVPEPSGGLALVTGAFVLAAARILRAARSPRLDALR